MNRPPRIPWEELRLRYEYENGLLFRTYKKGSRRQIGSKTKDGYLLVTIRGHQYAVHRIIWAWHFDVWPEYLDHRNGRPDDNRIENLRECTMSENARNRSKVVSASGFKGVCLHKQTGKYQAQIGVGGRSSKHLGLFATPEAAAAAYDAAARSLYGEFASTNADRIALAKATGEGA